MPRPEQFEYETKRSFGARFGFAIGFVVLVAVGIFVARQVFSGKSAPVRRETEMVMIRPVAPPPPPPPPPPQPVPQPEQQVEDVTQVSSEDMKQADEPPSDPTPSLGTGITGNGNDGFGLGGRDRGMIGGTGAGGGGSGSRFGGYFTNVVRSVTEALGRHAATRNASFDIRVRIWSDATGRINRVRLVDSTQDAALDRAIRGEALIGCQLPDIPDGMRMPLQLRLNLRRPN